MSSRKVVIFGGGKVGERKAFFFKDIAPTVVISDSFTDDLITASEHGELELIRQDIDKFSDKEIGDIVKDAFLIVTATNDPELNSKLAKAGEATRAFVNTVDYAGDVVVPSVIRQDPVLIGISTMGNSPALSRYTRLQLEKVITPAYGQMAKLQDECREYLKSNVAESSRRKLILWEILEKTEVWDAFAVSYEKAYNLAYDIMLKHIETGDN